MRGQKGNEYDHGNVFVLRRRPVFSGRLHAVFNDVMQYEVGNPFVLSPGRAAPAQTGVIIREGLRVKPLQQSYFERASNYYTAQGDLDSACRCIAMTYKLTDYEWLSLLSHMIHRLVEEENKRDWNNDNKAHEADCVPAACRHGGSANGAELKDN